MARNKNNPKSFLDVVPGRYIYLAAGLVVVALVIITFLQKGTLYRDTVDYEALQKQNEADQARYAEELAAIQPDYEASRQFLKQVASEDLVKEQIYEDLHINQKITVPVVTNNQIQISPRGGKDEVVSYLTQVGSLATAFNRETSSVNNNLFSTGANPDDVQRAASTTSSLVEKLRATPVPREAVDLHKAQIVAYQQYSQFLKTAYDYQTGKDTKPWAKVYAHYAVINDRMAVTNSSFQKLDQIYKLSAMGPQTLSPQTVTAPGLFKVAQAQVPTGSATIVIKDLPRVFSEAVKVGLARAFARFMIESLDKLVAHIEKNFAIASQLYYSQALGQFYSIEYMKKFVKDSTDQKIIQYFLPQYFCASQNAKDIQDIFITKAKQYVTSIGVPKPSDPDYYSKIAKYGDFMASPSGWQLYYEGLAAQTQSEASAAATKEVISPGLKTGRSLVNDQIAKTAASIFNVQQAAIAGTINLGTNNAENVAAQMVAGVVENLTNKYVFTAITGGQSSGIGVLQEQGICIKTPQFKPIAPVPQTTYSEPPPFSDPEETRGR